MKLPRVYPIVDSAAWVRRLAPLGVRLLQLRIKNQPPGAVGAQITAAHTLCRAAGIQLVVNDYWQQALELGCDFVHLGQEDLGDGGPAGAAPRRGAPGDQHARRRRSWSARSPRSRTTSPWARSTRRRSR